MLASGSVNLSRNLRVFLSSAHWQPWWRETKQSHDHHMARKTLVGNNKPFQKMSLEFFTVMGKMHIKLAPDTTDLLRESEGPEGCAPAKFFSVFSS